MPHEEEHRLTVRSKPWTSTHRLMVSLPIFIILIGVLVSISNLTTVPWNIEPTGQSMATLTDDTEVTFDNPSGETLPAKGTYEVTERYITLNMTSDGNLTKESGARGKANAEGIDSGTSERIRQAPRRGVHARCRIRHL